MAADEFGRYMDYEVGGVPFRMRYIEAGSFLMGSPESEPGRYDDEKQHEVVISEGFWLAETACTQKLWCEVMGNNPSQFRGNNLPVENVSWNDCKRFLDTINDRMPCLGLRLPSEAEWEYACRAGTQTPFSFGENITPKQVNYDGNYPYFAGNRGKYREATIAVKSLPCNDWGLYEMHGNIWEWCSDLCASGGSLRVMRGGSWFDFAKFCRSAARYFSVPDSRLRFFGFRVAKNL